jgi:hypothetical protein
MIEISKSPTADTRTCDFANTEKDTLLASSRQHIADVVKGMAFFVSKLTEAAGEHDYDKLTAIDWFHSDFVTGFERTGWWDNHRRLHRHHLNMADGVPTDVNLLDVLEYIADCVMAGMARSGTVYQLELPDEVLQRALANTVELLKSKVTLKERAEDTPSQCFRRAMQLAWTGDPNETIKSVREKLSAEFGQPAVDEMLRRFRNVLPESFNEGSQTGGSPQ